MKIRPTRTEQNHSVETADGALQLEWFHVCHATAAMFRHIPHPGGKDGTLLPNPRQQCSLRMPKPNSVMQR